MINSTVSSTNLLILENKANYDDVTTQLYWGYFVLVVVVNIVVLVVVFVIVNVVVVALLVVTDHIIFSCGQ